MAILGYIIIIVGIALVLVGRLTKRSLPPDYSAESDDGFSDLLSGVGKGIMVIGIIFIIGGIVCIIL